MRFWKRRKKAKEQPEAKQNIEDVLEHLNTRGAYTDSAEYKRQAEHEMLGRCEEIIEAIRELEEAKSEYRIVTDYLNDIQKIRNIPKETQEDLHDPAEYKKEKLLHNKMTEELAEKMRAEGKTDILIMSAGPYKKNSCMSAYCVDAQKMADAAGMLCWTDDGNIRYFSQILFHE